MLHMASRPDKKSKQYGNLVKARKGFVNSPY